MELVPYIPKLLLAFIISFAPILIWIWFWEHEDKHPEPKKLVVYAMIAGMMSVLASLILEHISCGRLVADTVNCYSDTPPAFILLIWSVIEEISKFSFAAIFVLQRRDNDEPVDSMMYMIMTALGFAALENVFYIFTPIHTGNSLLTIAMSNMRFIGPTLLHTAASGIVGFALAVSFYKDATRKIFAVTAGLITAIALHWAFNLSIITFSESRPIIPFFLVWVAVVVILLAFEEVKRITNQPSKETYEQR